MKKPAIYVFTTAYDPFIGGAEIAIHETVTRLSNSFSFFIFTARIRAELPHVETKNGITIIRVGFGNAFDKLLLIPLIPLAAIRWFRKHPPALLWSVMISYAFPAAMILKWWRGVPLLLTLQEGNREWEFQFKNFGMSWLGWRVALKSADSLAAISTFLLNLSRKIGYSGEGVVIPNGVDIGRFRASKTPRAETRKALGIPQDAFLLITTSRLVYKNGVDIVLKALARLPLRERNATHFLIVGSGELESSLRDLAKNFGLRETAHFIGERGNDELPDLLAAADAFIRPSRSEGLGISFIEALAAGLPAIGSNVGGIPDVIQDGRTGLLAEPENPEDLAKKILLLQEDSALAKSLAAAGTNWARGQFTWEAITKKYQMLFFRLTRVKPCVLIATGVYPPDIGGTAKIASLLKGYFEKSELETVVFAYGKEQNTGVVRTTRELPTGIRHLQAFFTAFPLVWRSNAVFLLDHFSIGFPTALAARILGRPYLVRVGGDFLWESSVESTRKEITLPAFYSAHAWSKKELIIFHLSRWVMKGARLVVFTTSWQEEIFIKQYGLVRTMVIANAPPAHQVQQAKRTNEIIYAGRFIYLKNLHRLLRAFHEWKRGKKSTLKLRLIGDGPEEKRLYALIQSYGMSPYVALEPPKSREGLLEAVSRAWAVIVPSFSDISPNLVLEGLSLGVPAVLTKYSGYALDEPEGVIRIDPMSSASFVSAFDTIASPAKRKKLSMAASGYDPNENEDSMTESYKKLIFAILT